MTCMPQLGTGLDPPTVDHPPVVRVDVHNRQIESHGQLVGQGGLARASTSDHRDTSHRAHRNERYGYRVALQHCFTHQPRTVSPVGSCSRQAASVHELRKQQPSEHRSLAAKPAVTSSLLRRRHCRTRHNPATASSSNSDRRDRRRRLVRARSGFAISGTCVQRRLAPSVELSQRVRGPAKTQRSQQNESGSVVRAAMTRMCPSGRVSVLY